MGNAPKDQVGANDAKRDTENDSFSVVRPPSTTPANIPPADAEGHAPPKKCRWTKDPLMAALTAAGLVALIVYTAYTRQLVIDSEGSSTSQAKITREIMQLDQRAWIGLESMDAIPYFPEVGKTFAAKGTIINTGKTPALNIFIYSIIEPVLTEGRPNFSYVGVAKFNGGMLSPNGKGFLGPLQITRAGTTEPAIVAQEQVDLIKQGRFNIYTHGRIDYDDIFGNHHWMTYCNFLLPSGGFGFCHEHNDTDDNQKVK